VDWKKRDFLGGQEYILTLLFLRALIKLLLPTFGNPTTPIVIERAEDGRYDFNSFRRAGAVLTAGAAP
jgi:hypothetical protein